MLLTSKRQEIYIQTGFPESLDIISHYIPNSYSNDFKCSKCVKKTIKFSV